MIEKPEDGKLKTLIEHCMQLYTDFSGSEYRAKKVEEIQEGIKRYEQDAPDVTFPWSEAYNVYLPLLTITIDNLEPRLVAGLTGRDPIVAFGDTENASEPTKILEDWYNKELLEVVKIYSVAMGFVHTILKEGTYFGRPLYDFDEREISDFEFTEDGLVVLDEGGAPVKRVAKETLFEGGEVQQIPFTSVFCADDLGTIEEWEEADKIIAVNYTYAELQNAKDEYLPDTIGPWLLSGEIQRRLTEANKSADQLVAGIDITGKEVIECLECHITFPTANLVEEPPEKHEQTDFTEERIIVTIAKESRVVLKLVPQAELNMNNESLIKRGRLFPEFGRSFGTSMYGKMKAIQDGASQMFSLLMNIATICMMPWYFYEDGAGVQGKQEVYPGAGVKVNDVSKIKFAEYRVNPRDYIEFLNLWFDLWERLGGISDPQIGASGEGNKTATEVLTVVEEGNIKHNYQSTTFKEEFLQIVRTLYDLYYQYMPYDKTIMHGGQELPFPRAFMRRPDDFRLVGSTEKANKLIERKENEDLFNMLRGDPLTNPITLVDNLIKSYGRENTKEYISPEIGQLMQAISADPNILPMITQAVSEMMAAAEAGQAQG